MPGVQNSCSTWHSSQGRHVYEDLIVMNQYTHSPLLVRASVDFIQSYTYTKCTNDRPASLHMYCMLPRSLDQLLLPSTLGRFATRNTTGQPSIPSRSICSSKPSHQPDSELSALGIATQHTLHALPPKHTVRCASEKESLSSRYCFGICTISPELFIHLAAPELQL